MITDRAGLELATRDDVVDGGRRNVVDHPAFCRGLLRCIGFFECADVAEVVVNLLVVDDVVNAELHMNDGVAGDEEAVVERVELLERKFLEAAVFGVVVPEDSSSRSDWCRRHFRFSSIGKGRPKCQPGPWVPICSPKR